MNPIKSRILIGDNLEVKNSKQHPIKEIHRFFLLFCCLQNTVNYIIITNIIHLERLQSWNDWQFSIPYLLSHFGSKFYKLWYNVFTKYSYCLIGSSRMKSKCSKWLRYSQGMHFPWKILCLLMKTLLFTLYTNINIGKLKLIIR